MQSAGHKWSKIHGLHAVWIYSTNDCVALRSRSSLSRILSHNEVAYYIGFVLIEEEDE